MKLFRQIVFAVITAVAILFFISITLNRWTDATLSPQAQRISDLQKRTLSPSEEKVLQSVETNRNLCKNKENFTPEDIAQIDLMLETATPPPLGPNGIPRLGCFTALATGLDPEDFFFSHKKLDCREIGRATYQCS